MSKERLVIVSGSYPDIVCGISPYVRRIAELLADRGEYEVHVLTAADKSVKPEIAHGYEVHGRVKQWGPQHGRKICKEILRLKPTVVHIQNPTVKYGGWRSVTMSVVVPMLKRMAKEVRVAIMQHDIALSKWCWRWRFRPLLRAADAIVVSNRRDYQAVMDQGISSEKIYLARFSSFVRLDEPNAASKQAARERLGIKSDSWCAAYFGFVLPERNVDVLIRALMLLRKEKKDVHGIILGGAHSEAPDCYEQCRGLASELKLDAHMTWTGFASEEQIADGLAAADVFVSLPERGADMRNTSILTGILAQLPIVTSGNDRYYTDPDIEALGCVCVGARDVEEVAKAITQLCERPPLAEVLAQRAAELEPNRVWAEHVDITLRALQSRKKS